MISIPLKIAGAGHIQISACLSRHQPRQSSDRAGIISKVQSTTDDDHHLNQSHFTTIRAPIAQLIIEMAGGMEDAAIQFAETIQTASINRNPDPNRDIAPETSVDKKVPVQFDDAADAMSEAEDVGEDEVPISVLRPLPEEPRAPKHLQLPDLRFEQSYLKSISQTNDWRVIAYITIKDQVWISG